MIDLLINMKLGKHPGRGKYKPDKCKIYTNSLQDQQYKMNPFGRHPFNIFLTKEMYK